MVVCLVVACCVCVPRICLLLVFAVYILVDCWASACVFVFGLVVVCCLLDLGGVYVMRILLLLFDL